MSPAKASYTGGQAGAPAPAFSRSERVYMANKSDKNECLGNPEQPGSERDPEERPTESQDQIREKMFDKTLADSFPTSDPPSSIPDPSADDTFGKD
jgi:hypothetical protein